MQVIKRTALLIPALRKIKDQRDGLEAELAQAKAGLLNIEARIAAQESAYVRPVRLMEVYRSFIANYRKRQQENEKQETYDAPSDGWSDAVDVKSFWEKCHNQGSNVQLTGSNGPDVWEYLKVLNRIQPGRKILNIGVGFGKCTRELAKRGCRVQVLDISHSALESVAATVEKTWHVDQLNSLPEKHFDLAISNLVAQHMNDANLKSQIHHVLNSLGEDGVFAMQITYPLYYVNEGGVAKRPERKMSDTAPYEKSGSIHRNLSEIAKLVEEAGGVITYCAAIQEFAQFNMGWYAIHIMKRPSFSKADIEIMGWA